jgi:hypothetical protein
MTAVRAGGTMPMRRENDRREFDAKHGYKYGTAGKSRVTGISHIRKRRFHLEPHV